MKHENLIKQANSLESCATLLQSSMLQIALVNDIHEDGSNIFPTKKDVIEDMAISIQTMRDAAKTMREETEDNDNQENK